MIADAGEGLRALSRKCRLAGGRWWTARANDGANGWRDDIARLTRKRDVALPLEGDVIGAGNVRPRCRAR